jgi:hypothetical protein
MTNIEMYVVHTQCYDPILGCGRTHTPSFQKVCVWNQEYNSFCSIIVIGQPHGDGLSGGLCWQIYQLEVHKSNAASTALVTALGVWLRHSMTTWIMFYDNVLLMCWYTSSAICLIYVWSMPGVYVPFTSSTLDAALVTQCISFPSLSLDVSTCLGTRPCRVAQTSPERRSRPQLCISSVWDILQRCFTTSIIVSQRGNGATNVRLARMLVFTKKIHVTCYLTIAGHMQSEKSLSHAQNHT